MSLEDHTLRRRIIVPDSDCGISRATRDEGILRVDADIVHGPGVPDKLVGPRVGFETSGQHDSIHGGRDDLLHVVSENTLGDLVLVLLEGLHHIWIFA